LCEVSPDIPCAWVLIYKRLRDIGRLDDMKKEVAAKDWSKGLKPGRYSIKEKEEDQLELGTRLSKQNDIIGKS
jgi:hypothetical protein